MKIKIEYRGGMHFIGGTDSGHQIHWDSGPKGAKTEGPAPMEAFLQATAACTAMDVVYILKKRRKEISIFEVEAEAERKSDYPKIFDYINITYRVGGDGITKIEAEKAVKLSFNKYCSITNMIRPTVKVTYKVELFDVNL